MRGILGARVDAVDPNAVHSRRPSSEEVVRAHYRDVWRALQRFGARPGEIEDLTQEVFLIVHHRLPTYDASRPIKPWLYGIAFNAFRAARRLARNAREEARDDFDQRAGASRTGELEAADLVHRALAELDEDRRIAFVLYELEDVPVADIAQMLEVPVDTVYSRLRKAREEFRAAVAKLQKEGTR